MNRLKTTAIAISLFICCLAETAAFDFSGSNLPLSDAEKRVMRRELVEIDISIRSVSSLMASGDLTGLKTPLNSLRTFVTADSPRWQAHLASLKTKLQQRNLLDYFLRIQKTAAKMHGLIRPAGTDWNALMDQFQLILQSTRDLYAKSGIK